MFKLWRIYNCICQVHPNLRLRDEDQRLELRTVNALRNVEHDQWLTTYDYNYTGMKRSNFPVVALVIHFRLTCSSFFKILKSTLNSILEVSLCLFCFMQFCSIFRFYIATIVYCINVRALMF